MNSPGELIPIIRNVSRLAKIEFAKVLAEKNLTLPQFIILKEIKANQTSYPDGISPAVLSEKTNVLRSTITGILDRLEKSDLIIRKDNPHDRRAQLIRTTSKYEELFQEVTKQMDELTEQLVSPLDETQLENLIHSVKLIEQSLIEKHCAQTEEK